MDIPIDDVAYWTNVAAEELAAAMVQMGIGFMLCAGDGDGDVTVGFQSLRDAEALMTLAVTANNRPGSLYDRATSSCVTLSSYVENGIEPTDDDLHSAIVAGWTWNIHPFMTGRRMDWHVSMDIPVYDATQLTANLNALRVGGVV